MWLPLCLPGTPWGSQAAAPLPRRTSWLPPLPESRGPRRRLAENLDDVKCSLPSPALPPSHGPCSRLLSFLVLPPLRRALRSGFRAVPAQDATPCHHTLRWISSTVQICPPHPVLDQHSQTCPFLPAPGNSQTGLHSGFLCRPPWLHPEGSSHSTPLERNLPAPPQLPTPSALVSSQQQDPPVRAPT